MCAGAWVPRLRFCLLYFWAVYAWVLSDSSQKMRGMRPLFEMFVFLFCVFGRNLKDVWACFGYLFEYIFMFLGISSSVLGTFTFGIQFFCAGTWVLRGFVLWGSTFVRRRLGLKGFCFQSVVLPAPAPHFCFQSVVLVASWGHLAAKVQKRSKWAFWWPPGAIWWPMLKNA